MCFFGWCFMSITRSLWVCGHGGKRITGGKFTCPRWVYIQGYIVKYAFEFEIFKYYVWGYRYTRTVHWWAWSTWTCVCHSCYSWYAEIEVLKTALVDKFVRSGLPAEPPSGDWKATFGWLGPKLAILMFAEHHAKYPRTRASLFTTWNGFRMDIKRLVNNRKP